MTRYGMVIDLHRCAGCGGCIIGCKNENNLSEGVAWSSKITRTVGKFPHVRYDYVPTLCNHCANAPCVAACPTEAMYKAEGGITMIDSDKCIGCKYCMAACPYGVIHFSEKDAHPRWRSEIELIPEATSSPMTMTEDVGATPPYYNPAREDTLPGVTPKGVVGKCTFCDHRVSKGQLPYCVEVCPANARVFGDLDDPESEVSQLIGKYSTARLREDLGTEPKVHYIRSFQPGGYEKTKGRSGMKRKLNAILIGSLILSVVLIGTAVSPAVGQEGMLTLATLAEQIRSGEIDVGDEFGMDKDQRFHVIHADTLGMDCSQCHVEEAKYEVAEATSKEGPVDRRVCLGCHLTGPATKLYEPKE